MHNFAFETLTIETTMGRLVYLLLKTLIGEGLCSFEWHDERRAMKWKGFENTPPFHRLCIILVYASRCLGKSLNVSVKMAGVPTEV
jgi:hypothetical protein